MASPPTAPPVPGAPPAPAIPGAPPPVPEAPPAPHAPTIPGAPPAPPAPAVPGAQPPGATTTAPSDSRAAFLASIQNHKGKQRNAAERDAAKKWTAEKVQSCPLPSVIQSMVCDNDEIERLKVIFGEEEAQFNLQKIPEHERVYDAAFAYLLERKGKGDLNNCVTKCVTSSDRVKLLNKDAKDVGLANLLPKGGNGSSSSGVSSVLKRQPTEKKKTDEAVIDWSEVDLGEPPENKPENALLVRAYMLRKQAKEEYLSKLATAKQKQASIVRNESLHSFTSDIVVNEPVIGKVTLDQPRQFIGTQPKREQISAEVYRANIINECGMLVFHIDEILMRVKGLLKEVKYTYTIPEIGFLDLDSERFKLLVDAFKKGNKQDLYSQFQTRVEPLQRQGLPAKLRLDDKQLHQYIIDHLFKRTDKSKLKEELNTNADAVVNKIAGEIFATLKPEPDFRAEANAIRAVVAKVNVAVVDARFARVYESPAGFFRQIFADDGRFASLTRKKPGATLAQTEQTIRLFYSLCKQFIDLELTEGASRVSCYDEIMEILNSYVNDFASIEIAGFDGSVQTVSLQERFELTDDDIDRIRFVRNMIDAGTADGALWMLADTAVSGCNVNSGIAPPSAVSTPQPRPPAIKASNQPIQPRSTTTATAAAAVPIHATVTTATTAQSSKQPMQLAWNRIPILPKLSMSRWGALENKNDKAASRTPKDGFDSIDGSL